MVHASWHRSVMCVDRDSSDMIDELPVMQYRLAWRNDPPPADHVGAFCMTLSSLAPES
jgi:hypothetical protein